MCSWWDVSRPRRGDLDGVVVLVADPRPLDGDLAEGRLEGERPCPPALDTGAGFAAAVLQDHFLVGLLDEGSEEPALDLKAGLMDERLDLVGRCSSWDGTGRDIPSDSCSEKA